MDQIKQNKYKVEKDIVDKALTEYGNGRLARDELKEIANFTVEGIKKVNNRLDLASFLKALSAKWQIFENIAIIEEGNYRQEVEDEVYSGVLTLAQQGKVDSAIKLAKTMTN